MWLWGQVSVVDPVEPLYDSADMGGIVPCDPRTPFDVRKVRLLLACALLDACVHKTNIFSR